ncbi:MAG: hypothetical protein ACRD3W_03515, partial [Terriglobales bacterium]
VYGGKLSKRLSNSICRSIFEFGGRSAQSDPANLTPVDRVDPAAYADSRLRFCSSFEWVERANLRLSPDMVYWRCGDRGTLIVHTQRKTRVTFAGRAEFTFWKIIAGHNRRDTIAALAEQYDLCEDDAVKEVDEFIDHILLDSLVERVSKDGTDAVLPQRQRDF